MTDSESLRDWFEDQYDYEDFEPYLFGEEDLGDVLEEIHDRRGDSRKSVDAITHDSDFIEPFERQIENETLGEIDNINDLDKLDRIAQGTPKYRLVARNRGIQASKNLIQGKSLEDFPPEATSFLRKYSPQTLGGFVRQEARKVNL